MCVVRLLEVGVRNAVLINTRSACSIHTVTVRVVDRQPGIFINVGGFCHVGHVELPHTVPSDAGVECYLGLAFAAFLGVDKDDTVGTS